MGSAESRQKTTEAHKKEAERQFSQDELTHLRVTFNNLSENHQHFQRDHFKAFCNRLLPDLWSDLIYGEITQLESDHNGYATFICSMAKLLKGSTEEFATILSIFMAKSNCTEAITKLVEIYMRVQTGTNFFPTSQTPSDAYVLSSYLLNDYQQFCTVKKYPIERQSEAEVLQRWFSENLLVPKLLQTVFSSLFLPNTPDANLMPKSIDTIPVGFQSLMTPSALLALNNQLPMKFQSEWKLLYSTQTMGESFATFVSSILRKGPTLLVIKDSDGRIFGGFCPTSWALTPTFFGDDRTFLFTLAPDIRLFTPTGFNQNFCYLNDHQETLPNGLGFGGRIELSSGQRCQNFSLWIDKTFEWGESQSALATFNSPQMSLKEKFLIASLEVWAVQPDQKVDMPKVLTSILDSDPEAKAILSMSGRGQLSEGLRESDSQAESPSDHKRID